MGHLLELSGQRDGFEPPQICFRWLFQVFRDDGESGINHHLCVLTMAQPVLIVERRVKPTPLPRGVLQEIVNRGAGIQPRIMVLVVDQGKNRLARLQDPPAFDKYFADVAGGDMFEWCGVLVMQSIESEGNSVARASAGAR